MHQIIHLLQLRQAHNLIRRLDEAPPVKVKRLARVLPIPDVAPLDGHHLDD